MAHYDSYDSFKTKKSIDKKNRAKELSSNKQSDNSFVVPIQEIPSARRGTVLETTYREAKVIINGDIMSAFGMRGNIPCNQIIFPGDIVDVNIASKKIEHVSERKTILSRDHSDSTRKNNVVTNKILATNIDTAVIVVSAYSPPLHPKFIDRYLMILDSCGIEPIICLNKSDLKTEHDEIILDIYRALGLTVVETSVINNDGLIKLKNIINGKCTIFVGHSGVGKSSLTNAIMESDYIKVGKVGEKSKKGRHTTTSSKYYIWNNNSSIIDTPGIRALDVSNFQISDIVEYFEEFKNYLTCKYRNCDHVNIETKDCGIKQAVLNGYISPSRYESYKRIISELSPSIKKR